MQFLTGKKTYLVAAIAALIGVDQGLIAAGVHVPPVPGYVIMLLGAFGLYSVRSAITTSTAAAVTAVLSQVSIPPSPLSPAALSGKTMTAKANGTPYASFIAAGWDDAQLIAGGYMTSPTT